MTPRVERISCVIGSLGPGGAERVLTTMANWWVNHGRGVTIYTLQASAPFFWLDERVTVVALGLCGGGVVRRTIGAARRVVRLRRALLDGKPDVVVSFIDVANVHALLAAIDGVVPVVISERTDPRHHQIGTVWRMLRRMTYPTAAQLVLQSAEVAATFSYMSASTRIIPNPVLPAPIPASRPAPDVDVVAMGRFTREKGFDLLLKALQAVSLARGATTLRVWGDGPEKSALMLLAHELGIANQVEFPGNTTTPTTALQSGKVFVLPSRYEGFPNVLGEAMAVGLPSIAFDTSSGPRQLIRHGIDGILVHGQDVNALAAGIVQLLDDPDLRDRMEIEAPRVTARFGLASIMARWDDVLDDAVQAAGK
ncbi:MAG: glycosyltransferase family 4 protein [Gemmatimonadaceae bacterium]